MKERHERVRSIGQFGEIWTDEGREGNVVQELDELRAKVRDLEKGYELLWQWMTKSS